MPGTVNWDLQNTRIFFLFCLNSISGFFIFRGFCIGRQIILLLVIFTLMSLQNILGYFLQIRQYQKMIRKWLGKGILGIGQRRGLFTPGEILILVYNSKEDAAISVQSMRGYSVFVRFKEKPDYTGLSLEELRRRGLEEDRRDLKLWRIIFDYNPEKNSKRKGALIQAVEGIEKYLRAKYVNTVKQQKEETEVIPAETAITGETTAAEEKAGNADVSGIDRTEVSNNLLSEKENA